MTTTTNLPGADALRARRAVILAYWRLDERGFAPVREQRELRGDEWSADAELDSIDFLLATPR